MPKVQAIRVFDIPSDSRPGTKYKVQFDGERWYCPCLSWVNNVEHRGEKDADGRAVPRECKHTRRALGLMQTKGAKAYRVVQPAGPWFEELQEYIASLVEVSRNGRVSPEKLLAFNADLGRFKEDVEKLEDTLNSANTMIDVYRGLLRQISERL